MVAAPTFNHTWGGFPPTLPPSHCYDFSSDTEVGEQGCLSFCQKTQKSGVCTICAAPSSGTATSKIRKVLFLEIVLVEKIITLFRMLSTSFPPLVLPPPINLFLLSPVPLPPFLTSIGSLRPPQVLLESALKHWSRVKRYVAQDGSG